MTLLSKVFRKHLIDSLRDRHRISEVEAVLELCEVDQGFTYTLESSSIAMMLFSH